MKKLSTKQAFDLYRISNTVKITGENTWSFDGVEYKVTNYFSTNVRNKY